MMKDNTLKKLVKSLDIEAAPPEGLKEDILSRVVSMEIKAEPVLTPFERFFFEKPLRAACVVALPVAGSLWAIMGSNFINLLSGIIR